MSVLTATSISGTAALLRGAASPVVVIPVYDSYDDVVRCVEAIVTHTPPDIAILVVDDGGADRRTLQMLAAHSRHIVHDIVVLEHAENEGFVRSCNDAFAVTAGRDVVFVNSDVVVGAEWLTRLTAAALSSDSIATVTTLTNHGTIVSVPYRNHPVRSLPDHMTPVEAARRIAAASRQLRPEIPTGIGHCLYIKRSVVDLIGTFDEVFAPGYGEEVDFCQRASARGFHHVVADDVFTFHRGGATFGESPEVLARRASNEAVVRRRYPWYASRVRRAEVDRASALADALSTARRALLGLTVGVDALCIGPDRTGTQVNTIESVRALSRRPEITRLVVFVRMNIGVLVDQLRAEMPGVEFIGISLLGGVPENVVDVMYRPYQVAEATELEFLHRAGDRFVINQLDTIAFENPGYFENSEEWLRYRDVTRLTLELAGGIAFISQHSRQACLRAGLVRDDQPSAVVSCGTDERIDGDAEPVDAAIGVRPGFLLGIGTSFVHKNRTFTLQVWAELRRRGWAGQLIFAGSTPSFGNSLALEAEFLLGIPEFRDEVVDLGAVSESQKLWLYQEAAMVLYPSTMEGFGMVPFEAAQHGVPTLSTRLGSLDEILPAGIPAFQGFDVVRAADDVWEVLHDQAAARKLTAALAARSLDFTWAATAARLVDLFEAALSRPRNRVLELESEGALPIRIATSLARPVNSPTARRLERLVQEVIARPSLKRALSPEGSRRQSVARSVIERGRKRFN